MKGAAPVHIWELLSGTLTGTVDMVNSRGIYLDFSDRKVLLCPASCGVVPNGAAVESWDSLPPLLEVGAPVSCAERILRFPTCSVELVLEKIENDLEIQVPSAKAPEQLAALLRSRTEQTGLAPLVYVRFGTSVDTLNPWCRMANAQLQTLLTALERDDLPGIFSATEQLLGLGPGLTPSGDDVLSGLMYGLRHSNRRNMPESLALVEAICGMAKQKTTAVSAEYLLALAQDAPFERMATAWRCPETGGAALMKIGNNSGSEMVLGLLLAGELLQRKGG